VIKRPSFWFKCSFYVNLEFENIRFFTVALDQFGPARLDWIGFPHVWYWTGQCGIWWLVLLKYVKLDRPYLTLPYLRGGHPAYPAYPAYLHLPSAEAVSVRPNAQPRCNQKVTVIGCEAETSAVRPKSAVKPNESPDTWDWWRVVWLFLSGGLRLVSSSPSD